MGRSDATAGLDSMLETALAAARDAVGVHRANVGRVPAAEWTAKGTSDFVTHVDREAEARIVARIAADFPEHRILAEEQATGSPAETAAGRYVTDPLSDGWVWVIDPLDGTTNFLHRYPMYSVSIAALLDGEPAVGVVMNSVTGETWTAMRGLGAHLDGRALAVSDTTRIEHALIGTGFPFKALDLMPRYLGQFDRVIRHCSGIRRAGSAALDLCHVASGWFDGFWELVLAPWDVAAGVLIVREAGGLITRLDGVDTEVMRAGSLLAGNATVHAALASILQGADA
jgi:myo-inositol-1(or 4)-monophosphatase